MTTKTVIGVYDSLAKAEKAELHLEEVQLPVGLMSLIAPSMEDGQVVGDITAHEVAEKVADTGVRLAKDQIAGYEEALKEGKLLLIVHGDGDQVARAYQALENTDNDDLVLLGE